jgi:hypothetical protein
MQISELTITCSGEKVWGKNGGHFVLQQRLGAAQAICLDQKLLYSVIG